MMKSNGSAAIATPTETLLTTSELATRWSMNPQVLINWRSAGRGPRYIHIGRTGKGKRPPVRYRLSTILDYEKENNPNG